MSQCPPKWNRNVGTGKLAEAFFAPDYRVPVFASWRRRGLLLQRLLPLDEIATSLALSFLALS